MKKLRVDQNEESLATLE